MNGHSVDLLDVARIAKAYQPQLEKLYGEAEAFEKRALARRNDILGEAAFIKVSGNRARQWAWLTLRAAATISVLWCQVLPLFAKRFILSARINHAGRKIGLPR